MSLFLGPAGTGMSHFKRGTGSAAIWSRKGQEDRRRVKASGGIAVLSSGLITPCLENAWTAAVVSGRISLVGF